MRALRSGALLFRKDLRVLVRSRGLLAVLIGYPIVIAILLAIALSGGDRRPGVAFVNLDAAIAFYKGCLGLALATLGGHQHQI